MSFDAEKVKSDFPILRNNQKLIYLDNAATSQKPERVIQTVENYYSESNSNVGRSMHSLAVESSEQYREARREVADFFGTDPSNLVFTSNTTDSINLLAESLELGGKAVFPETAHHSLQLPFREKLDHEFIPVNDGKIDLEAAKRIIDGSVDIVGAAHISNLTGQKQKIEDLAKIAHENNAIFLLDAAQSAPRTPIDFANLPVDALVFSGHKMCGPMGTGGLIASEKLQKTMDPSRTGGGMISKVRRKTFEKTEFPQSFEAGTPNVAGAVGLAEACRYLRNVGLKEIEKHEKEFVNALESRLNALESVEIVGSPEENRFLTSLHFKNAHPHDAAEIFDQKNIAVRAGFHCVEPYFEEREIQGTLRISPYLYNTIGEASAAADAAEEVVEVFNV